MKLFQIISLVLLLSCIACTKTETRIAIADCTALAGAKILTEEERGNNCFHLEVYRYQSAHYTICNCCICDKLAIPIDCEGIPLCEFPYNCITDFYEAAEYLYSVTTD